MITIALIGALAVAVLVACAGIVAAWRARVSVDERVAEAVSILAAGMQETMRDVVQATGEAESSRRAPAPGPPLVSELAATLDLDEVTGRTLSSAAAVTGVDAALVEAGPPEGARVRATVGLADEEAPATALQVPDDEHLRAIEVTFHRRPDETDSGSSPVRAGVVFPLRAAGLPVGTLGAYTRAAGRRFSDGELDELERVALRAGPAIDNARRYTEARALADIDALTGLHNRRFFHETLAHEVIRARRYQRRLALIVVDLDDFKNVNDQVGHLAGDGVLAEVSARMQTIVRSADIACRVGGDEFAVILPEAGSEDAELLAARISEAISGRPIAGAGTLRLSAGVAELRAGDQPNDLFERADEALYLAKERGKAQTVAADGA